MYTPTCEKITIVKHANDIDYWVITHKWNSNSFYSYLVTANGISNTPVVSNSGTVLSESVLGPVGAVGNMKISPDGSKLILCNTFFQNAELFDFDTNSGQVSNPKILMNSYFEITGAEFSPNNKVLYISESSNGRISQFDLTSSNIASTRITVSTSPKGLGSLQLAINNKIYVASWSGKFLDVIENPDVLGLGCNFKLNGLDLKGFGSSHYGLPTFSQSYFNPSIITNNLCLGSQTEFTLNTSETINSISWDLGDGTTLNNVSPKHMYSSPGKYLVKAKVTTPKGTVIKSKEITITSVPTTTKPNDLLVCDDNNDGIYSFDLTSQNSAILNGQDPNVCIIKYSENGDAVAVPSSYKNKIAYQKETITAEVYNKFNNECKSIVTFDLAVFDSPLPNISSAIPDLSLCDNTSIGTDNDGKAVLDLTKRDSYILNGQSANQFLISYYKDAALTQLITLPNAYHNTSATETIFAKITNKDNITCFGVTSFNIDVFALPVISNLVDLKQCDDDIDGYSLFNLEEVINKITANSANEIITFYKTLFDAENNNNIILNQTAYRNQMVSVDKVYARVTNSNKCYKIAQVNLIVSTTQIPSSYSKSFNQCDDAVLGTNKDGVSSFDFSAVTSDIKNIFPSGQLLDVFYYQNIEDALAEKNAIKDISNYRNTSSSNTQKIYIRVDSRLDNDCLGLGGYIILNVEPIPVTEPIERIHCDDNQDGLFAFDTSDIESKLLNGLINVRVSYLDQNNVLLPSPLPNPFITASQTVKVIVTNNTATSCSYNSTIKFVVDDLPEVFSIDPALTTVCDDESDPLLQDGNYAFDTSSFESILLGSQIGMTVNYYDANNTLLPSPLPNPFITTSQNVKEEVINPKNDTCKASGLIEFIIKPLPKINLKGEELVCSNLPTFTKQIDAGLLAINTINDYDYQWYFNATKITNETNYSLIVNKEGIFTVDVTDKQTHCYRTRTIKVSASDIASNVIAVVDESNTISISVTGNGDYVYTLDDQDGFYQNENTFLNVPAGIHTVYIKDQNGCGAIPKEVAVFGIPAFFTPNQDGYNDYWNIEGVNNTSNKKTIVQIFDRYGKLLKQINPLGEGWDGTYLGAQMPSDDYWYIIKLEDSRIFKGHFTLKR
ncbi:PKD domain protein [compost metagenome]